MVAATQKQLNLLNKLGVNIEKDLTIKEASILIAKTLKAQRQNNNSADAQKENQEEKTKIFTKAIFQEFKDKYYQTEFSYFKESNYNTYFKYILKIENYYIHFENPTIQTRFCFGHGYCGVSTQEEENDASNMAHYAATNEQYFMNENLRDINQRIADLQEVLDHDYASECVVIENNSRNTQEVFYQRALYFEHENKYIDNYYCGHNITDQVIRKLTREEIELIIAALNEIKDDFTKRLNTYLKKYGLSKIDTWTYLVD